MKLQTIQIKNYRSLEAVSLSFPTFYCAISGRNDSGKTNVLKAIQSLFRYQPVSSFLNFDFEDRLRFSIKNDFARWLSRDTSQKLIEIETELSLKSQ
jgi:putative ATP-dependent endonuclease of OLD family